MEIWFFLGVGLGEWARYKKFLFVKTKVNFFISCLVLKNLLGRLNQQSSCVMRIFYPMLNQQLFQSVRILFYFRVNQLSSRV